MTRRRRSISSWRIAAHWLLQAARGGQCDGAGLSANALAKGVYTASAGNMAQGVAWNARRLGIPCSVVVPDHAPATKLAAIERLGGRVIKVPFRALVGCDRQRRIRGAGRLVHPPGDGRRCDGGQRHDWAGNPGGPARCRCGRDPLWRGRAELWHRLGDSGAEAGYAPVSLLEVETAAPLAASLRAGEPVEVAYAASFVDGIGGRSVLPEIWPLARALLDGSLVVSLEQVRAAIRLLAERGRVIAEGAGAASVPRRRWLAWLVAGWLPAWYRAGILIARCLAEILTG